MPLSSQPTTPCRPYSEHILWPLTLPWSRDQVAPNRHLPNVDWSSCRSATRISSPDNSSWPLDSRAQASSARQKASWAKCPSGGAVCSESISWYPIWDKNRIATKIVWPATMQRCVPCRRDTHKCPELANVQTSVHRRGASHDAAPARESKGQWSSVLWGRGSRTDDAGLRPSYHCEFHRRVFSTPVRDSIGRQYSNVACELVHRIAGFSAVGNRNHKRSHRHRIDSQKSTRGSRPWTLIVAMVYSL